MDGFSSVMEISAPPSCRCRVSGLEKRCTQSQKEKELIEKKMQRMEKAKEQEVQELRDKLEASQGDVRANLKAKDDKINEVCAGLGGLQCV